MGIEKKKQIMVGKGRDEEFGVMLSRGDEMKKMREEQVIEVEKNGKMNEGKNDIENLEMVEGLEKDEIMEMVEEVEES